MNVAMVMFVYIQRCLHSILKFMLKVQVKTVVNVFNCQV